MNVFFQFVLAGYLPQDPGTTASWVVGQPGWSEVKEKQQVYSASTCISLLGAAG